MKKGHDHRLRVAASQREARRPQGGCDRESATDAMNMRYALRLAYLTLRLRG
jgi:hypothetical protein